MSSYDSECCHLLTFIKVYSGFFKFRVLIVMNLRYGDTNICVLDCLKDIIKLSWQMKQMIVKQKKVSKII